MVIPALNEERPSGRSFPVHQKMVEEVAIVDEIVVMDGFPMTVRWKASRLAHRFTLRILRSEGKLLGKGVALWKSQFVTW